MNECELASVKIKPAMQLLALALVLSGLWSLGQMLEAWGQGKLMLNTGPLNLLLAHGLLRHRRWARDLILLFCVLSLLLTPVVAVLASSGEVPVRYDLPWPVADLTGPPAIALVAVGIFLLALSAHALLTSDAGRVWFGLSTRRPIQQQRLWSGDRGTILGYRPIGHLAVAAAACAGALWMARRPTYHLELVAARGGILTDLAVSGSRGYAIVGGRVAVLDLSDPDQPMLLGQSAEAIHAGPLWDGMEIAAAGDRVVVSHAMSQALWVVSAADPAGPLVERRTELPIPPDRILVAGDRTFVLGRDGYRPALSRLLALGSPDHPAMDLLAQWQVPGFPRDLAAGSDLVLALTAVSHDEETDAPEYSTLLSLVKTTAPARVEPIASIPLPASSVDVLLRGNHAYVLTWDGYLLTLDLRHPAQPEIVNTMSLRPHTPDSPCTARMVDLGGRLLVNDLCAGRLITVDLATPDQPRVSGRADGVAVQKLAVGGERLYALEGRANRQSFSTVAVLDIADPNRPRISGRWTSLNPSRVVPLAERAYVVQPGSRLMLMDVAQPEKPVIRGEIGPPRVMDAAAADGRLFVVDGAGRFGEMAASGAWSGSLALSEAAEGTKKWRIHEVNDGRAYLTESEGRELVVVGLEHPDRPQLKGRVTITATILDVAVRDRLAYVAIQAPERPGGYSTADDNKVDQVLVLDLSDLQAVEVVGAIRSWKPLEPGADVHVAGDMLVVGHWAEGGQVYTLRDPRRPVGQRYGKGWAGWSVALADEGLLVRGNDHLQLFYTDTFRQGVLADTLDGPMSSTASWFTSPSIALGRGVAYLANLDRGLLVVALREGLPPAEEQLR